MNNKGIGAIFCLISAILISVYYLTAAIFMSNVTSWNAGLFAAGLEYEGPLLLTSATVALVVGILFLGYGVFLLLFWFLFCTASTAKKHDHNSK